MRAPQDAAASWAAPNHCGARRRDVRLLASRKCGRVAANQADAMRYVGDLLGGGVWRTAIVAMVLVSTSSTLWTTVLYLLRSVFAMGRDGVLWRRLGWLDQRSEPLWALATVGALVTVCELVTGFSPSAADALIAVLSASSVFWGCSSPVAPRRLYGYFSRAARHFGAELSLPWSAC